MATLRSKLFVQSRAMPLWIAALIAGIWLNQGSSLADWERSREAIRADPEPHWIDTVRAPFLFLYRRAADEELYYVEASAMLGRSHNLSKVPERGDVPAVFRKEIALADGQFHWPYREVPIEYPPFVIPFILFARAVGSTFQGFAWAFGAVMGGLLIVASALCIRTSSGSPHEDDSEARRRGFFLCSLLLAAGAIAIQRLDATVALAMAFAVWAAVRRRPLTLGLALGAAAGLKFLPILILPVIVAADDWFVRDRRARRRVILGLAISLTIAFGPMFFVSPSALFELLAYHAKRGLHVESVVGTLYGLGNALFGATKVATLSYGSFNYQGAFATWLASACGPLTMVAIAVLSWLVYRSRQNEKGLSQVAHSKRSESSEKAKSSQNAQSPEQQARTLRITLAVFAAVAALWTFGKVFSPQYLLWAIPLTLAVPRRYGTFLSAIMLAALLVTQLYHRGYYDFVCEGRALGVVTLVVRQALVLAMLVLTVKWLRKVSSAPSPSVALEPALRPEIASR